jgi:hypothetical protein
VVVAWLHVVAAVKPSLWQGMTPASYLIGLPAAKRAISFVYAGNPRS